MGPDPWSSLTSGGYCVQLEDGKFLASTDVVVENAELGDQAAVDLVVQERFHEARDQHLAEAPRRRLRFKQGDAPHKFPDWSWIPTRGRICTRSMVVTWKIRKKKNDFFTCMGQFLNFCLKSASWWTT